MTTATGGTTDDDAVVTTEVEPEAEPRRARAGMSRKTVLTVFLALAAVALLAALAAVFAILWSEALSAAAFRGWLFGALGVLIVVIIAEIVLLVVARPRKA